MEFVVNVWHELSSDEAFERTIPLALNGRRIARLGWSNPIHAVFLRGLDRLSARYLGELRDLGYRIHDASRLVAELMPRVDVFAERWKAWGGIKHYGLLRFLVMPRLFPGTSLITFDGDMIVNAPFADMAAPLGDQLYFLGGSSCFGSIPAGSDFFAVFEQHVAAIRRDPEAYARDVAKLGSAEEFFNPLVLHGTDQGVILHLIRQRLIQPTGGHDALQRAGLVGFPNILTVDGFGWGKLRYERRDGIDYLNGRKILIWHMSHDVCAYLGQFVFLRDWLGEEGVGLFGRLPLRAAHYKVAPEDKELSDFFARLTELTRKHRLVDRVERAPFSRARVCRTFFDESDFGFALRDQVWHTAGVFE